MSAKIKSQPVRSKRPNKHKQPSNSLQAQIGRTKGQIKHTEYDLIHVQNPADSNKIRAKLKKEKQHLAKLEHELKAQKRREREMQNQKGKKAFGRQVPRRAAEATVIRQMAPNQNDVGQNGVETGLDARTNQEMPQNNLQNGANLQNTGYAPSNQNTVGQAMQNSPQATGQNDLQFDNTGNQNSIPQFNGGARNQATSQPLASNNSINIGNGMAMPGQNIQHNSGLSNQLNNQTNQSGFQNGMAMPGMNAQQQNSGLNQNINPSSGFSMSQTHPQAGSQSGLSIGQQSGSGYQMSMSAPGSGINNLFNHQSQASNQAALGQAVAKTAEKSGPQA